MLQNKNIISSSIHLTLQPTIARVLNIKNPELIFKSVEESEKYIKDLEDYLEGLSSGYRLINNSELYKNYENLDDCYFDLYIYNSDNYKSLAEAKSASALYQVITSIYGIERLLDCVDTSINTQKALGYLDSPLKYYFK